MVVSRMEGLKIEEIMVTKEKYAATSDKVQPAALKSNLFPIWILFDLAEAFNRAGISDCTLIRILRLIPESPWPLSTSGLSNQRGRVDGYFLCKE